MKILKELYLYTKCPFCDALPPKFSSTNSRLGDLILFCHDCDSVLEINNVRDSHNSYSIFINQFRVGFMDSNKRFHIYRNKEDNKLRVETYPSFDVIYEDSELNFSTLDEMIARSIFIKRKIIDNILLM